LETQPVYETNKYCFFHNRNKIFNTLMPFLKAPVFPIDNKHLSYMKLKMLMLTLPFLGMISCSQMKKNWADSIYYGGNIVTMEGDTASYAEAVALKDGKIIFVGSKKEAEKLKNSSTLMNNLQGKTMLPGFIDAHGHLFNAGFQAVSANLLPPPDGTGADINSLIAITKDWQSKNQKVIDKAGWIIGFGYDDAQLKEKRHPEASDLDKISKDIPVMFIHQSGHLGVLNSKGLELAGYRDGVKDPSGGVIRRIAGSEKPNGVLEEMAMFIPVFKLLGSVDDLSSELLVEAGVKAYTQYGYTTAQEGRATKEVCETYKKMAANKKLTIDVYAYPDIQKELNYMVSNGVQKEYDNHFRIAGVKLSADGSPQGKTAWLTKPYLIPPPGKDKNYAGYPAIANKVEFNNYVAQAFKNNWQILTHCNGDAAADEFINAVELAEKKYGNKDRRTVMIHAQTVREDQLDKMKRLGIIPSFFSMHTFYWGDWHDKETLGRERAFRISPTQSALNRGMIFTEHHDAPVANPNALRVLSATVNRTSRSGIVIGPDQRVSPYIALKSITDWASYQAFEEKQKGTIKAGKLADFVILDRNPLTIDPLELDKLKVMETIKEGKTVYKAQ
jgi:predicted amidohydrolase YtcJ